MNAKKVLLFISPLLFLSQLGAVAQDLYIPSPNEPFYGTWVNEKMNPPKAIHYPDGTFEDYKSISDTTPFRKGKSLIIKKSTDADGNVYYETNDKSSFGPIVHSLWKVNKYHTALEMVGRAAGIEQKDFPREIDPKDPHYFIYYRSYSNCGS